MKTMFVAKIKTTMIVLCGVAALGLGTGSVLYQTQAGEADAPQAGQRKAEKPATTKALNDADRNQAAEKERLQALAEDLRAKEQTLHEELQKAREEAEAKRVRAEGARAEAEKLIAELEAQLEKAKQAELDAKKKAEQILYAATLQQAQREWKKQAAPEWRTEEQNPGQRSLRDKQAQLQDRYVRQRESLQEKLRIIRADYERSSIELAKMLEDLEVRHRKEIADLEREIAKMPAQAHPSQPKQPENRAQPSGDKLDRILDRLEQIERRLERLERNTPRSGRKD